MTKLSFEFSKSGKGEVTAEEMGNIYDQAQEHARRNGYREARCVVAKSTRSDPHMNSFLVTYDPAD